MEIPINSGNSGYPIGIDRGVHKTLALSDGTFFLLPKKIKEIENNISRWQRSLRLKKRFSTNTKKMQKKIGRLHQKIALIRKDFLHKISVHIAKNHSYVVIEDLKIKNMTKSA
jgi:putative transposase